MKAVRVVDGVAAFVDADDPTGAADDGNHAGTDLVAVSVVSSSICGSDLHLIDSGFVEGLILGHEFAGRTPDGTPVAVEPVFGCGTCRECGDGAYNLCSAGPTMVGIATDGGMAETVMVPASTLVPLPSGMDLTSASLVEPLAVAEHALNRARVTDSDRICVLGAGPIGLAVAAVLRGRHHSCDIAARHPHQQAAADALGANVVDSGETRSGNYDVVMDAVGITSSLQQAVASVRPRGRIGLVGTPWTPAEIDVSLALREVEIVPSMMYGRHGAEREIETAARLLAENPDIATALITQRFPLDAATEAFAAAADRASGTIKVVFDVAPA